jgi:hypothetical protein
MLWSRGCLPARVAFSRFRQWPTATEFSALGSRKSAGVGVLGDGKVSSLARNLSH